MGGESVCWGFFFLSSEGKGNSYNWMMQYCRWLYNPARFSCFSHLTLTDCDAALACFRVGSAVAYFVTYNDHRSNSIRQCGDSIRLDGLLRFVLARWMITASFSLSLLYFNFRTDRSASCTLSDPIAATRSARFDETPHTFTCVSWWRREISTEVDTCRSTVVRRTSTF